MEHDNIKEYRLWFCHSDTLEKLGHIFRKTHIISNFEYDSENVYEWLVCQTDDENINLNISRRHNNFEDFNNEPITVMAMYLNKEPEDTYIDTLGSKISNIFVIPINLGSIEHLGGDDYNYNVKSVINA